MTVTTIPVTTTPITTIVTTPTKTFINTIITTIITTIIANMEINTLVQNIVTTTIIPKWRLILNKLLSNKKEGKKKNKKQTKLQRIAEEAENAIDVAQYNKIYVNWYPYDLESYLIALQKNSNFTTLCSNFIAQQNLDNFNILFYSLKVLLVNYKFLDVVFSVAFKPVMVIGRQEATYSDFKCKRIKFTTAFTKLLLTPPFLKNLGSFYFIAPSIISPISPGYLIVMFQGCQLSVALTGPSIVTVANCIKNKKLSCSEHDTIPSTEHVPIVASKTSTK